MAKISPDTFSPYDRGLDELERLSNSVVELFDSGRLDDADRACRKLRRRYPDMIDWIGHTGALHEARGEISQAIEHDRLCIDFIDKHPEGFDRASKSW